MKITSIITTGFLLLVMSLCIPAQGQFNKPLKSQKQNANLAVSDYTIGFTVGCPWSVMTKSDLSNVKYSGNIGYSAGLLVERYFSRFSLGLEGLFSQKGTRVSYEMPYQISLNDDGVFARESYLGYNLISVRLPVSYYLKGTFKDDKVIPYFFIAPQIDLPLPFNAAFRDGKFSYGPVVTTTITNYGSFHDEVNHPATMDWKKSWNTGILAGVGLMARIPTEISAIIIKFNVALNYGLLNLAWEKIDGGSPLGIFLPGDLCIRSHDVEANLSVVFPIKRQLKDACYYLQR